MAYKKGVVMVYEIIIALITILLGTVLILYFISGPLKLGVSSTFDKFTCKESIDLKAHAKSVGLQENVPLKCSSQTLTFDSTEKINEEIAKSMYDCWDQFYQGKSDFLTNYELTDKYPTFCFKCASINFDSTIKGNNLNLGDYIKNKDNLIPEKQDMSYLKFFTGSSEENKDNLDFIKGLNNLNTNEELYVFFVAQKFRSSILDKPVVTSSSDSLAGSFYNKILGGAVVYTTCKVGFVSGGTIGGLIGTAIPIPIIGTVSGATVGAISGCVGAVVIATGVYQLSEKDIYSPFMIIKPAKEAVQICNERSWFKPNEK